MQGTLVHVSFDVQNRPSSHASVLFVFAQLPLARSQVSVLQALLSMPSVCVSVTTETPTAARQAVWDDTNASAAQSTEATSETSFTSQTPAEARHTVSAAITSPLQTPTWQVWLVVQECSSSQGPLLFVLVCLQ